MSFTSSTNSSRTLYLLSRPLTAYQHHALHLLPADSPVTPVLVPHSDPHRRDRPINPECRTLSTTAFNHTIHIGADARPVVLRSRRFSASQHTLLSLNVNRQTAPETNFQSLETPRLHSRRRRAQGDCLPKEQTVCPRKGRRRIPVLVVEFARRVQVGDR